MELGEEVKRAFPEMTGRQRQLLDVILQVERYCEMRSLETWEAMAVELYDDDVAEGTLGDLLEEIVQLGRGQLYCGFSRQHAYDDYQAVRTAWRALRPSVPEDALAVCWHERSLFKDELKLLRKRIPDPPSGRANHGLRSDRSAVFAPPVATIRRSFGASFALQTPVILPNNWNRLHRVQLQDRLVLQVGMLEASDAEHEPARSSANKSRYEYHLPRIGKHQ